MVFSSPILLLLTLVSGLNAHSLLSTHHVPVGIANKHARRHIYKISDTPSLITTRAAPALPSGWNSTSTCLTDSSSQRLLSTKIADSNSMTVDSCISQANTLGYTFAGIEFGQECWVGNSLNITGTTGLPSTDCTYACQGDSEQICGGYNAISVYTKSSDEGESDWSATPVCIKDSEDRALANQLNTNAAMTWETCLAWCDSNDYSFCGLEYGGQCYGAETLSQNYDTGLGQVIDDSNCDMTCPGNPGQQCGGSWAMTLFYKGELPVDDGWPEGWDANQTTKCITDYVNERRVLSHTVEKSNTLTNLGCVRTCAGLGYEYAGTEYGQECYCGHYVDQLNGGATSEACDSPCSGNADEICGGYSTVTLWQKTMAPQTWIGRLPEGWTNSSSCVIDSNNPRALSGSGTTIGNLDLDSCVQYCDIMGWSIAGAEWSKECWCADAYAAGNDNGEEADGCDMPCGGNPNQICGGLNRMTVYTKVVIPLELPDGWSKKFCAIDTDSTSESNILQTTVTPFDGVSAANCIDACPSGTTWAGVKNGNECYCGTYLDLAIPSVPAECSTTCESDADHTCGGPSRIQLFTKDPDPVPAGEEWTLSEVGNSGVVMTGIAVMNEETVIVYDRKEKNPLLNSEGFPAWAAIWNINEMDPRELDIETHSFCSAGAWLSNGTFVNFGGQGTVDRDGQTVQQGYLGVRLFNPCLASENCQVYENIQRIRMAEPRWYPTSVRLHDGSALLIGGSLATGGWTNTDAIAANSFEFYPTKNIDGSNGLELQSPFLVDAMPHNTYPHAFALPNHQIFMAANNLATFLDWQTNTETRLPNLPDGQRVTYPYSGVAILLPLTPENDYTPEVVICGGSHNDNDIKAAQLSAQTSPTSTYCSRLVLTDDGIAAGWSAESMPDQRVMLDGVLLPTGKIVIVNGAKTGTASYGNLNWGNGPSNADFPAFTPLLYDPEAPIHERFSYAGMPTSDIPRMYHSVATLLPSGAILLGGSNPNDDFTTTKYESELRVEYLYPSYMSADRPTFTGLPAMIDYTESFTLTVSLPEGATDVYVALIDLGWSTHNNHMDQRYVKLESTLVGDELTVVGPPHDGIYSPGPGFIWVIADGVPSEGQKTLIGTGEDPPFDEAAYEYMLAHADLD